MRPRTRPNTKHLSPRKPLRLAPAWIIACLFCVAACDEGAMSGGAPAGQTEPSSTQANTTTAQDMPLFEVQSRIAIMIDNGQYAGARALLTGMDLVSYVEEGRIAGEDGLPQYWAVKEDGTTLPYLGQVEAVTGNQELMAEIKQTLWVVPGTSNSPQPGEEQDWQDTARRVAGMFNKLLYEDLSKEEQ